MNLPFMERLAIEDECRRIVALAAAHSDAGDHAAFSDLFCPDGVLVRPDGTVLQGPQAILAAYLQRPAHRMTRHVISGSLFSDVSATQCHAISTVTLWVGDTRVPATPLGRPVSQAVVVGEFDDHFERVGEIWCIARREARFLLSS